jgi:putative endonuclease
MTNPSNKVLYVGMTNNLLRRLYQHRSKQLDGFTKRYNVTKLVYFEPAHDLTGAITREKQLKAGSRKRKIDLINMINPQWKDLDHDFI